MPMRSNYETSGDQKYEDSMPCSLDSDLSSRMNFVPLLNSFLNPIKQTEQVIETLVTLLDFQ